jgi:hypothetical protein
MPQNSERFSQFRLFGVERHHSFAKMRQKTLSIRTLGLFALVVASCTPDNKQQDMRMGRREMLGREPVKASPARIISQMEFLGEEATQLADSLWRKKLSVSKDSSCRPTFQLVADSVNYWYMSNMTQYAFGSKVKPVEPKTLEIVEAFEYSHLQKQPISPNVQKLGESELLFTKALVLKNAACSRCHKQVSDTVGLWLFQLPKKEVILSLADK